MFVLFQDVLLLRGVVVPGAGTWGSWSINKKDAGGNDLQFDARFTVVALSVPKI